jgi:hypothetical protein
MVAGGELMEVGDLFVIRNRGHMRTIDKDHELEDGDVVELPFSS